MIKKAVLLTLLMLLLAACTPAQSGSTSSIPPENSTAPSESTPAVSEPVHLKMNALILDSSGEPSETMDLEISGKLLTYENGKEVFDGEIKAGPDFRYTLHGGQSDPFLNLNSDPQGYFASTMFAYDTKLNELEIFSFAFDTNSGYAILSWKYNPESVTLYIVASTESNPSHGKILEHFSKFVEENPLP